MYSLIGVDGNAFSIMGYTATAMKNTGFTRDEISQMYSEAMSSDYDNLLAVCGNYIDMVNDRL